MGQPTELIEDVQRAFQSGDFSRFPELVAADAEIRNPFTTIHGPAEFAALGRGFVAAISERRIEVLAVVENGDAALAQIRVTGRHTGALPLADGEAPPTGDPISFEEAGVVRVRDGRIVSWHSYYDALALAQQLGSRLPSVAPADRSGYGRLEHPAKEGSRHESGSTEGSALLQQAQEEGTGADRTAGRRDRRARGEGAGEARRSR